MVLSIRKRIIPKQTNDEKQKKTELEREWTNYKIEQQKAQLEQIRMAIGSQEKALKQLKKDNIDLYNMAIQVIIPWLTKSNEYTLNI
jgi:hypothetical protein